MKKNTIITFGVIIILLLTSTSVVAIDYVQQNGELKSITIENTDNIDRWAVIIAVNTLRDSEYLYSLLQEKDSRWNTNNMKLILGESATKQNIINALDWLIENADEGDIVIFSYNGHGMYIDDEPPFDESDGKDEVICPYDYFGESGQLNYISDDVLCSKFDEISNKNVKGMFLIFSSCFSGGLFDWTNQNEMTNNVESLPVQEIIDESIIRTLSSNIDTTRLLSTEESLTNEQILNILDQLPQESKIVTTESNEIPSIEEMIEERNAAVQEANNFTAGLMEDISADNRVILASTHPHALSVDISWEGLTFHQGICKAIDRGKTAAEDISEFAKCWWLYNYYINDPLFFLWLILFPFVIFYGSVPMWKDGYPANDPSSAKLIIIGDGQGESQAISQPISQPGSQPSTQPSSLPSSTTTSTSMPATTTTTVTSTTTTNKSTSLPTSK